MNKPQTNYNHPDAAGLWSSTVPGIINFIAMALSLGLIAFISWDTYRGVDYLENSTYMKYQFAVCLVFLAEYIYRFTISKHKLRFFFFSLPFLAVSIPYLNIIEYFNINLTGELLHLLCSIPIFRGLAALVFVVNFFTKKISTTVFMSYVLILLPVIYMSGLFFYVAEKGVNTAVKNLWYALWWAGMNVTTIGCYINPVTTMGMVLGLVLSLLGIVMLPLFTVYLNDVIQMINKDVKK